MMSEFKLVPVTPTEEMLNVMHERVLISVDARKKEANILNDKAWWAAVVDAAPQPPALGGDLKLSGEYHADVNMLLAEIERQKGREMGIKEEVFDIVCKEHDMLKALIDQVRAIAEDRAKGYASREHGGVLNGRCMDRVCALFETEPAAKDGE